MRILLTANASYAAAARRRDPQQPDLARPDGVLRAPVPHRLRGYRRRRGTAPPRIHPGLRGGGAGAAHPRAAAADPGVSPRLGAGLLRGPGPRPAAGGAPFRAGPRGLPGAHAAVLSLRSRKLESRPSGGRTGGAVGRNRRHRSPHGGIHRARTGPPGCRDSSAHLRPGPLPGPRQLRPGSDHHDQSLRGQGNLALPRNRRRHAGA